MTSSQVSIDENGNEWILPIDYNSPNCILGFSDDLKVPSYSHNVSSSNIDNLPSVFDNNDKIDENADKYIADMPKIDENAEKSNADINETIRKNSLMKTMDAKRLLTFAKYENHNKKARPKYSGLTLKQAKYHNELIEVLLKNGLYEKVFNKSYMGNGDFCFDSLNENEMDLLSMFECIEPELLENCYIDITTPDNP